MISWKLFISEVKSVEIPTRCNLVIEFTIPKFIEGLTCFEPSINFEIININQRLQIV
jgi:hypothetical protein